MLNTDSKDRIFKQPAFCVGQFRFIDLQLAERQSGKSWTEVRLKAFEISARQLKSDLGANDMLLRCTEGFVVVFADPDPERSDAVAKDIAGKLNTVFQSDPDLTVFQIQADARPVDRADLSSALAATLRIEEHSAYGRVKPGSSSKHQVIKEEDRYWEYAPMWDCLRQMIVSNEAIARASMPFGEFHGRGVMLGGVKARDYMELDVHAIHSVAKEINDATKLGELASACVHIHSKGLADKSARQGYFDALSQIAPSLRNRIQLTLEGFDYASPFTQTQEIVRALDMMGFPIAITLPLTFDRWDMIAKLKVSFLAVRWVQGFDEENLLRLGHLTEQGSKLKLATILFDVNTKPILKAAIDKGVRMMTGRAIIKTSMSVSLMNSMPYNRLAE